MWAIAAPASADSATASAISTGESGTPGCCSRVVSGPVGATVMTTGSAICAAACHPYEPLSGTSAIASISMIRSGSISAETSTRVLTG